MTLKLYELSASYSALTDYLSSDESEDADKLKVQLANITEQLNVKAENIAKLILGYEAECVAIKSEVERLTKRKNTIENRTNWLKDYVKTEMEIAGLEKIAGSIVSLRLQKNPPSVTILDANAVPIIYRTVIPETFSIDKKLILKNFDATGEIPEGTSIETTKKHLVIK